MHEHKNSPPFFPRYIFPTFPPAPPLVSLPIHPFLHPSPSKASSQQSAIEFHYSLVMQHFKGAAACVCNCGSVYTCNPVEVRAFSCCVHRLSSSGTHWYVSCSVCKLFSLFFLIWNVLSASWVLQGCLTKCKCFCKLPAYQSFVRTSPASYLMSYLSCVFPQSAWCFCACSFFSSQVK